MSDQRPPAGLGMPAVAAFLASYLAVLAEVGITGTLHPQIDPLDGLCPVLLVLAGAMLGRLMLALAVALSLADVIAVHTIGHRPLSESLMFAVVYGGAAGCGWALRRWWEATSAAAVTEPPREADVVATGHAQAGFGSLPTTLQEAALNPQLALMSRREREVTVLAVEGLNSREIGRQLFISERTVETHLAKVYDKLEIHSRSQLIACLKRGKGTPSPSHARIRPGRIS